MVKSYHFAQCRPILVWNWTERSRTVITLRHCSNSYPGAFRCWGDLRVQDGALVPRHFAQLPCPWYIQLLSTVHQIGVAAPVLASLTAFLMTLCATSLDSYVPLQRTTFQFSQASTQLSFAAKKRHFPWLIAVLWTLATFCMASWLSCKLLASRDWNLDTRFLLPLGNCCTTYSELGIRAAQWMSLTWDTEYTKNMSALGVYIPGVSTRPIEMSLTRTTWAKLKRLRVGVGRFDSSMHKWRLASSAKCECGASGQTADHIILTYPIHRAPRGIMALAVLDDKTGCWLNFITATIRSWQHIRLEL